jgi:Ca2+-binding RTX toxin-like protein
VAKDDTYVANRLPSGNNIICAFVCGKKMTPGSTADPLVAGDTSNDTVIVGHNGRIDRCAALVSNGVGTPQGSDSCTWKRTPYGAEKVSSWFSSSAGSGVAQTGQLCSVVVNGCPATDLGSPRTRFTTLLGQSPTETIQAGTDYLEGNIGNNIIYGEDGPAVIHAVTPNQTDPATVPNASTLYPQYAEFGANFTLSSECLPNAAYSAVHNQNILIGGYGGVGVNRNLHDLANGNASNDVLCGGFGDDAILGNRGLVGTQHATSASDPLSGAVTPTPFGNNASGPVTIGVTGGPPYGVLTIPSSGNTIYPVRLDVEYSDGLLVPVPNWNNPTATGQANQHDIIFGGGGNNSIHGSPGADFVIGDSGIHVAGTPVPCAAVPPSSAPPTPCAPTGDNIIFGGGGNDSIEGGAGNADIFGGAANKDIDVRRSDTTTAPKVDNNGVCMPLAFGTISVTPASLGAGNGYCAPNPSFPQYQWANQSYASRFPLPTGSVYDVDTSGRDNGGTASHTTVFGHVTITGLDRTIAQAQGFGDRMIGPNGSYNLYYVCPAAYGGYQIIRAFKPGLLTFMQQLAGMDGAYNVNQTAKPPTTPSSGDYEINFVYPTSGNTGSAYPTTTGHFTC